MSRPELSRPLNEVHLVLVEMRPVVVLDLIKPAILLLEAADFLRALSEHLVQTAPEGKRLPLCRFWQFGEFLFVFHVPADGGFKLVARGLPLIALLLALLYPLFRLKVFSFDDLLFRLFLSCEDAGGFGSSIFGLLVALTFIPL